MNRRSSGRACRDGGGQEGYVLVVVMLVLMVVGLMASTFAISIIRNEQHVARDRSYSLSLAVAEAGLNQFLWMVEDGLCTEANQFVIPGNESADDPYTQTLDLSDGGSVRGSYTLQVTPPSGDDARIGVKVTGLAESPTEVPRTITAHIGRPAFSEYILLVDQSVSIGGPLNRVWHGKTHSNTGIKIETANIIDSITCARETYDYGNDEKPGIWSEDVPELPSDYEPGDILPDDGCASRLLWDFPVPEIDFDSVTADFQSLSEIATVTLAYAGDAPGNDLGYYIKLEANGYRVAKVDDEYESRSYVSGTKRGGYLTLANAAELNTLHSYPDNGVIFVKDDVWVEGTGITERVTIASTGQLNGSGKNSKTSINVVGDLIYATKDGTAAVGLIAQNNVKIPMYAPMGKAGTMGTNLTTPGPGNIEMEVDAAIIAQQGKEFVNSDSSGNSSQMGPRRFKITFYGSVSSNNTPYRVVNSQNGVDYCGFAYGANTYDRYLLFNPPPHFPTSGSYQVLDWQELPFTLALEEAG